MTANTTDAAESDETGGTDGSTDTKLFSETGGLYTEAEIHTLHGTSSVEVAAAGDMVTLTVSLGAGEVRARLTPERADEVAAALTRGSALTRDEVLDHE